MPTNLDGAPGDLGGRGDVHDLVVYFYRQIVFDDLLGPVFGEIAEVDWTVHILRHPVSTPVNWNDGDDVIISPALTDDDAAARFPEGFTTLKPHLRLTPQPNR